MFQHDRHPEMQERQEYGDAWWIREVTAEGFVIVSCDLAIVDTHEERQAVTDSGARIVGFAKANYRWDMIGGSPALALGTAPPRSATSRLEGLGRRQGAQAPDLGRPDDEVDH